ncbi:MAG: hypothetical protein V5B36_00815 [Candidatus Accumulibacter sp. UW25]|jgi:hypothetical protein
MKVEQKEYVYKLECDGIPFYIGRTNNPARRLLEHKSKVLETKCSKYIQKALAMGCDITMEILQIAKKGCLRDGEESWIRALEGDGYKLTNERGGDTGMLRGAAAREALISVQEWRYQSKQRDVLKKNGTPEFVPCGEDCKCTQFCYSAFCEKHRDKLELDRLIFEQDYYDALGRFPPGENKFLMKK